MIIEFSVGNFRSIKDMQTLSFVATAINEHEQTHTFEANDKIRLLKSLGIYGANSSGKSNVIKAMWAMMNFIKSPFDEKRKFTELIQPFKLNTATRNEGSFFQIVFLIDGKSYRYGFVHDKGKITSEWLFGPAQKNEVAYFTREDKDFDINKERFAEGIGLENKTRQNNLFLNVVYEYNGAIAEKIYSFLNEIIVVRGNDLLMEQELRVVSFEFLKNENERTLDFMKIADSELLSIKQDEEFNIEAKAQKLLFEGVDIKKLKNIGDVFKNIDFERIISKNILDGSPLAITNMIVSQRELFDEDKKEIGSVALDFEDDTSDGTQKMFNYAGVILNCIESGGTLIIDEFDARLHTILTKKIIELFNSNKNKTAQLCFVTHDTNLLDKDLLRRDQIYFTEKNLRGETALYSLNEIKGIRNDASFEKDYIKGKYGAIPFVSPTNSIFG